MMFAWFNPSHPAVNLGEPTQLQFTGSLADVASREDFVLTGALGAPTVSLNGVPMALNAAGMPPDGGRIEGRRTPNRGDESHLALPALSSFFSVFSGAAAPACLAGPH
jgi:hypothetical protein